jgi:hypothetical protein
MKFLYVAAAFLLACFALSALAQTESAAQKSGQLTEKAR